MAEQKAEQTETINVNQGFNIGALIASTMDVQALLRQFPAIVAAVQKLSAENEALKSENESLKAELAEAAAQIVHDA